MIVYGKRLPRDQWHGGEASERQCQRRRIAEEGKRDPDRDDTEPSQSRGGHIDRSTDRALLQIDSID